MPKKVCPNGHIYDSSIYGDECPLCPKGGGIGPQAYPGQNRNVVMPESVGGGPQPSAGGTQINAPGGAPFNVSGMAQQGMQGAPSMQQDAVGETRIRGQVGNGPIAGGTMIRQPKGAAQVQGRKLVGFLVTYNRNPLGKAYNLYEGKNFIGRNSACDICLPDDRQVSGKHMSILYRNADNKFKYRDEQSSNGTFVNKELSDEGELQNYDIIRVGGTVFIFIAIPKLG